MRYQIHHWRASGRPRYPLEEQGAGGDEGQDPDVAGHLLEVVLAGVGTVGPEHERGGDQGHQLPGERPLVKKE